MSTRFSSVLTTEVSAKAFTALGCSKRVEPKYLGAATKPKQTINAIITSVPENKLSQLRSRLEHFDDTLELAITKIGEVFGSSPDMWENKSLINKLNVAFEGLAAARELGLDINKLEELRGVAKSLPQALGIWNIAKEYAKNYRDSSDAISAEMAASKVHRRIRLLAPESSLCQFVLRHQQASTAPLIRTFASVAAAPTAAAPEIEQILAMPKIRKPAKNAIDVATLFDIKGHEAMEQARLDAMYAAQMKEEDAAEAGLAKPKEESKEETKEESKESKDE